MSPMIIYLHHGLFISRYLLSPLHFDRLSLHTESSDNGFYYFFFISLLFLLLLQTQCSPESLHYEREGAGSVLTRASHSILPH